jgi:hypothetical protein
VVIGYEGDGDCEQNFFLNETTEEEMKGCFRNFRSATSNDRLKICHCVVCGREVGSDEGNLSSVLQDLSIRNLLQPVRYHEAHTLWEGALVLRESIDDLERGETVWICRECESALQRGALPRLALANEMWIGEVPCELSALTIPEQLLIARHYPRCFVFKLYPRGGVHLESEQLQRGMKGNVSLYELNTGEVVKMLEGQKLPNPAATLASVVVITFLGGRTLPKNWLKNTFRIRRRRVYEALVWLKENNCLYGDICIDDERLEALPEDGIPDEILSLIRHEADDDIVEKERAGYVNDDDVEGKFFQRILERGWCLLIRGDRWKRR